MGDSSWQPTAVLRYMSGRVEAKPQCGAPASSMDAAANERKRPNWGTVWTMTPYGHRFVLVILSSTTWHCSDIVF